MKIVKNTRDLNPKLNNEDFGTQNLKVFAHRVRVGGQENSLFEENAYTMLYIKESIELDAIAISHKINTDIVSTSNGIDGTKLKLENNSSYTILVDGEFGRLEHKEVWLFTIGETIHIPRANGKQTSGEAQSVYVSREIAPSKILNDINGAFGSQEMIDTFDLLESDANLSRIELVSINILNNIANSAVLYTTFGFPKDTKDDRSQFTSITNLRLAYDRSFAMSVNEGVKVKGIIADEYTTIPLITKKLKKEQGINLRNQNNFTDFLITKITPISEKNGVVGLNETRDFNLNIPWSELERVMKIYGSGFLEENTSRLNVKDLFIQRGGYNSATDQWKAELYQTLLAMLELTKAYANNFNKYQIKGTDGRAGINPDSKIGGVNIGLLGGTNSSDALSAIDGRIEDWKSRHPEKVNDFLFKVFKACILYLSEFIQSSYAVGKGLTRANRAYQIFYFDLITSIDVDLAKVDDFSDAKNLKDLIVDLKSEFYDINVNFINQHGTTNIERDIFAPVYIKPELANQSAYKSLDVDGRITLAETPQKWSAMNRPSKPGDVNITSDDLTRNYFYMPINNTFEWKSYLGETSYLGTQTGIGESIITVQEFSNWRKASGSWQDQIDGMNEKIEEITKMSKENLYLNYVRPNIPGYQKVQRVNRIPRVEVYLLDKLDDYNRKDDKAPEPKSGMTGPVWQKQESTHSTNTLGLFIPISQLGAGTDTYVRTAFTFQVRYWSEFSSEKISSLDDAVINKFDYLDKVETYFANRNSVYDHYVYLDNLELPYWPDDGNYYYGAVGQYNKVLVVQDLTSIEFNGLWGEEFKISFNKFIANETQTYVFEGIKALSKYDETQTKTKINL